MTVGALPRRMLLDHIVRQAERSPEVLGLLLFGSFACGTEDVYSDLDIGRVLDDYATAIAGVLDRHPDAALFASFPGTGPITTATLLAEIGEDRSRFPSPGSLLAEAGLAPVTRQSGSSRRVGFRYAANHHLRAAWGQWMLTAIRISRWTREAYDAARARGQSHSRAVRSVGARWGRILWRCWLDRQTYDPALDRRVAIAA